MTRVTWRGITTDAESAECWEAAATDPELDDVLIRPIPGYGSYRSNAASAGTDSGGGHVDLDFVGLTDAQCRRVETVYRRYGNFAAWRPERRPDGTRYGWQNHGHVLRMDCADLAAPGRTQLGDYRAGYNGLPIGGRINKDTGDRRYLAARWLALKAQQEEEDMALTADDAFTVWAGRKWNEYVDEDGSGTRERRTPIDVLFATHRAALLAARPNVDAIVAGVVAALPRTGAGVTTDELRAATAAGVREALAAGLVLGSDQ